MALRLPRPTGRNGFTLIELMIVVVIIGILASIAIPKFNDVTRSAREAEAEPLLKQIYTLQNRYFQKYDQYATTLDELEGGTEMVAGAKYYDFDLTSNSGVYVACARPRGGTLSYVRIDHDRNITKSDTGCT